MGGEESVQKSKDKLKFEDMYEILKINDQPQIISEFTQDGITTVVSKHKEKKNPTNVVAVKEIEVYNNKEKFEVKTKEV